MFAVLPIEGSVTETLNVKFQHEVDQLTKHVSQKMLKLKIDLKFS